MPNLGVPELLIIACVLVLLFGAKKLPEMARGVGKSLRIFKAETTKLREEDDEYSATQAAQPAPAQSQPQPAQPLAAAAPSPEEQARQLEEQAAKLRAQASANKNA
ncbi:Sec-independent protein translocase subunit TatA [Nonomuraea dietziae]|uniref:Sec-independent protein translocase protein TatA n=1 Tax=Nonomuraea dietziae TaxID=65515 RepID=A0A7W5VJX1_9ACTN|nr:Sec-independent protein translocase subunit TatA [Nonomuraea dietziae]MBB3733393.1 sec-independent protein translocase protein TatA [Nonomuraea dietziae]